MTIKNETIKKLTTNEMNDLGCFNIGIVLLRGKAKARIAGFKTTLKTETEVHYENDFVRHEMIKLNDEEGWAYRCFDKAHYKEYIKFVQPMCAINFVK